MKLKAFCDAVLKDARNFDFQKSLNMYLESKDYSPYLDIEDLHEDLNTALSTKNDVKLKEVCLKILDIYPFDIESHAQFSQVAFREGNMRLYHLHNFIASCLLDLILKSGDGKDYHTAYKINHPKDEMTVFTYRKKYPTERVSHEKHGKVYDIYTMEDQKRLFFDISIPVFHVAGEKI